MDTYITPPTIDDTNGHTTAFAHLNNAYEKCLRFMDLKGDDNWKLLKNSQGVSLFSMRVEGTKVKA